MGEGGAGGDVGLDERVAVDEEAHDLPEAGGDRDEAVGREGVVGDELFGGRRRVREEVRLVLRGEDDLVCGEVDLRPSDVAEDEAEGADDLRRE